MAIAPLTPSGSPSEVAEWLKAHAWNACIRYPRIEGSNPFLTAARWSYDPDMTRSPFPPEPPNPWRTLATRSIYKTGFLNIERNDVIAPDGRALEYTLARFVNRAVGVVPYENGGVWMVGQTRFALDQYSWELPEGGVPPGESMIDAARRELKEETGITAENLVHLFDLHTSNSCTDEWGQAYLATGLTHGEMEPEGTEDIQRFWVSMPDLLAAIDAGHVTDAITLAAVFRVELMRLRGTLV